jgi:hypothetical protein
LGDPPIATTVYYSLIKHQQPFVRAYSPCIMWGVTSTGVGGNPMNDAMMTHEFQLLHQLKRLGSWKQGTN